MKARAAGEEARPKVSYLLPLFCPRLIPATSPLPVSHTCSAPLLMRHCAWQRARKHALRSALGRWVGNGSPFFTRPCGSCEERGEGLLDCLWRTQGEGISSRGLRAE